MAEVRPLRALRYDGAAVDLGACLAPPYDVISEAEREQLYGRDPCNIVRVDYGVDHADDIAGVEDRYTRARRHLDAWLELGILRRDPADAVYVLEHSFSAEDGSVRSRRGLFCRVRARPWESADVIPHEHTMGGPKADRLALLRVTATQTSAVLCLYDSAPGLSEILDESASRGPAATATLAGEAGPEALRLRVIDEPRLLGGAREALAHSRLYIADGHHRFETAAAYAAERRAAQPLAGDDADFAWAMVHLCAADDAAVEVLPTHRLVRPGPGIPDSLAALLGRLGGRFDAVPQRSLEDALGAARPLRGSAHAIAVAAADGAALLVAPRSAATSPRRRLDVAAVQDEILLAACGLNERAIAAGALDYTRRVEEAAARVARGEAALAICLNGCTTREIIAVADAGEQMPQKSTYFVPKVPTGLVLAPL